MKGIDQSALLASDTWRADALWLENQLRRSDIRKKGALSQEELRELPMRIRGIQSALAAVRSDGTQPLAEQYLQDLLHRLWLIFARPSEASWRSWLRFMWVDLAKSVYAAWRELLFFLALFAVGIVLGASGGDAVQGIYRDVPRDVADLSVVFSNPLWMNVLGQLDASAQVLSWATMARSAMFFVLGFTALFTLSLVSLGILPAFLWLSFGVSMGAFGTILPTFSAQPGLSFFVPIFGTMFLSMLFASLASVQLGRFVTSTRAPHLREVGRSHLAHASSLSFLHLVFALLSAAIFGGLLAAQPSDMLLGWKLSALLLVLLFVFFSVPAVLHLWQRKNQGETRDSSKPLGVIEHGELRVSSSLGTTMVFPIAGVLQRALAFSLDAVFALSAFSSVVWVVQRFDDFRASTLVGMAVVLIITAFLLVYWLPIRWNGQTLGKRLLGLRVLRLDGSAIEGRQVLQRHTGRLLDGVLFPPAAIFAAIVLPQWRFFAVALGIFGTLIFASMPLWLRGRRRMADLIAGTVVVSSRALVEQIPAVLSEDSKLVLADGLQLRPGVDPGYVLLICDALLSHEGPERLPLIETFLQLLELPPASVKGLSDEQILSAVQAALRVKLP